MLAFTRINWQTPTPEDVAAGLSADQEAALLSNQPMKSLFDVVPRWRGALQIPQGYAAAARTPFGEVVARALQKAAP